MFLWYCQQHTSFQTALPVEQFIETGFSTWKDLFEQLICIISTTFTYINWLWFINTWLSGKLHSCARYEAVKQKGPKEATLNSWGEFFPSAKRSCEVLRDVCSPSSYRCPNRCELNWTSLFSLWDADFGNYKQFQSIEVLAITWASRVNSLLHSHPAARVTESPSFFNIWELQCIR